MFTTSWQVNLQLRHSKSVYMYDLEWHTCILFTYVTWTETFKTCFNYTTWTAMFTTCLPVCHELRCSNSIYLYSSLNWGIHNPFTYTTWIEIFTPAYLHALKWCLNPIHQYSSALRCEQFVDQYILTWDVCNLFTYTLRCLEPADMQALYWDTCNLLAYTSWTAIFIICW
jgi:hypothetical protein